MAYTKFDIGGCGCGCSCSQTYTVKCSSTLISGATVTVLSGETTIATGTTDGDGLVVLCVPAGTYTVQASAAGYGTQSSTLALTCGEEVTLNLCYTCGTCTIPATNLTVSWTNLILGNGSAPLLYSGSPTTQWISGCENQLLYELACTQNQVEFRVYYFVSGSCPRGQSQYCSTIRSSPFGLTQTSLTCSPFLLTCSVTSFSCPNLASNGYTGFTVSL